MATNMWWKCRQNFIFKLLVKRALKLLSGSGFIFSSAFSAVSPYHMSDSSGIIRSQHENMAIAFRYFGQRLASCYIFSPAKATSQSRSYIGPISAWSIGEEMGHQYNTICSTHARRNGQASWRQMTFHRFRGLSKLSLFFWQPFGVVKPCIIRRWLIHSCDVITDIGAYSPDGVREIFH